MSKSNYKKNYGKGDSNYRSKTGDSVEGMPKDKEKGRSKSGKHGFKLGPNGHRPSYDAIRSNDIGWYNKVPALYDTTTKLPFDTIAGTQNRAYLNSPTTEELDVRSSTVSMTPGIMRFDYIPTLGYVGNGEDPINRAFKSLQSQLAIKKSGNLPFTASTVAMMVTSLCSVASLIGHAKKAIEAVNLYTPRNYYYPRLLIESMGFDFDDLVNNKINYVTELNNLILMFNRLKVPNVTDLFARQYSLAHNVFLDDSSTIFQSYIFRPLGYYQYLMAGTGSDTDMCEFQRIGWRSNGNGLNAEYDDTINMSLGSYLSSYVEPMLAAWHNEGSYPVISGYLQAVLDEGQFITIDFLDLSKQVEPVVDRNMLWQISNLRTGYGYLNADFTITEDPVANNIYQMPRPDYTFAATTNVEAWPLRKFGDSDFSPEFLMESTRLMAPISYTYADSVTNTNKYATSMPDILIPYFDIIYAGMDKSTYQWGRAKTVRLVSDDTTNTSRIMQLTSQFRYCPLRRIYTVDGGESSAVRNVIKDSYFVNDLGNFAWITEPILEKLNETAMMSMFTTK